MIAGISVLEVITVVVDGLPSGYRWLNIVSNYLGFGLSPAVSVCLVYVLDRKTALRRKIRIAVCCEIAYLMFLLVSVPYGMVFSVSVDNMYSRGPHFYIYIVVYFGAILYLSASTVITAREFQNRSRWLIYPLILFVMAETIIQVVLPELHVTWLCVTLLSVLYFIYCNEMWNQLDALTGLLNQNSYLRKTGKMGCKGSVLVVFDVDDFKQINDSYGHVAGDAALCTIVRTIFEHVRADDVVLRYGGDEFLLMFEEIPEKVFQQKLEDIREEIAMVDVPEYKEIRLSMSVGGVYGSCKVRDGVMEADRLLYQAKRQKNCVAYKRI